ncbi:hypothetical protein REL07_010160 [Clostridioides difficile]|uniref:hypothetical protein n=2 Tax=Clostridioides difficile TaxID=1496 RepID=UPI00038D4061|nr:hypothetical protein [Clostridioides difficile]EQI02237.1 hypothetical protein QO7_0697 [Clostridioides difficile F314]CCL36497.1 hypothetical protein BN175_640019 [Clostridioides difficile T23]MBF4708802.1 hypothetical protein [Clostridioides difficile]MBG0099778.1 hypothetical protein [Clostridioides difficile]MBG0219144.1 hypothetical protein [Clostridioides difficile]
MPKEMNFRPHMQLGYIIQLDQIYRIKISIFIADKLPVILLKNHLLVIVSILKEIIVIY